MPLAWVHVAPASRNRPQQLAAPLVKDTRGVRTTIALKILMAVSGMVFIAFVLLHMYGNLKAFAGHDAYNEYAEHLRTLGEPMLPYAGFLWVLRVGAEPSPWWCMSTQQSTLWRRARGSALHVVRDEEAHRCHPGLPG